MRRVLVRGMMMQDETVVVCSDDGDSDEATAVEDIREEWVATGHCEK